MARKSLLLLALAVCTAPLFGATRLTYSMGDRVVPVYWPRESFPIQYKLDSKLVGSFPGGLAGVDRAFASWSDVPDADVSFRSLGAASGVRAGYDKENTVSVVDDLFSGQGFIAVTTPWYDGEGRLTEADIQIDPAVLAGGYNIQQAVQHEIGHLLGLDHSAVISSSMFPYVGRGSVMPELDSDDRTAIQTIYPKSDPAFVGGIVSGRVVGNGGGIFAAQVVAVDQTGQPVATSLTNAAGEFELSALPAGTYRVYAEPLDGPVATSNLTGVWRQAKVESFPTQFASTSALTVESGRVYGNVIIDGTGAPVQLNPRWIGVSPADSRDFSLTSTPAALERGKRVSIAVAGDGFTSGMTTFEVLNPGIRRVSEFGYASNYVYATFEIRPDAPERSAVILVRSGNVTASLTGALRIAQSSTRGTPARTRIAGK